MSEEKEANLDQILEGINKNIEEKLDATKNDLASQFDTKLNELKPKEPAREEKWVDDSSDDDVYLTKKDFLDILNQFGEKVEKKIENTSKEVTNEIIETKNN